MTGLVDYGTDQKLVQGRPMNTQHDNIERGDTQSANRPTYSAPRLQRLGRVSDVTRNVIGPAGADAGGYVS